MHVSTKDQLEQVDGFNLSFAGMGLSQPVGLLTHVTCTGLTLVKIVDAALYFR